MKTYIYQDEKSHKFWAVEQQGNELHISWGKVSTNGQSQVKSFADAAAAEKAELKLIAEKVKKGYVQSTGETNEIANSSCENDFTNQSEHTPVTPRGAIPHGYRTAILSSLIPIDFLATETSHPTVSIHLLKMSHCGHCYGKANMRSTIFSRNSSALMRVIVTRNGNKACKKQFYVFSRKILPDQLTQMPCFCL